MNPSDQVDLRQYIERILDERDKTLQITSKVMDHRLEGLNQLREQVLKDREQFMRKEVYDQVHASLVDRVSKLENFNSRILGAIVVIVAIAGLVGVIVQYLTRSK